LVCEEAARGGRGLSESGGAASHSDNARAEGVPGSIEEKGGCWTAAPKPP